MISMQHYQQTPSTRNKNGGTATSVTIFFFFQQDKGYLTEFRRILFLNFQTVSQIFTDGKFVRFVHMEPRQTYETLDAQAFKIWTQK